MGSVLPTPEGGGSQAGGNGGDVTVSNYGYSTIFTGKDFSRGIHAQSIGGGGGNGGDVLNYTGGIQVSASYAMGGRAGGGGAGGEVNIYSGDGSYIGTYGKQAHAIYAQSVGGGGGSGGSTANWNVTIGDVIEDFPSLSFGMSVGGSGGDGGHGGVAGVTSGATIETAGFRSYGIFAQSVGGGGGDGGNSMTGAIAFDAFSLTMSLGGNGGGGGNGNIVSVNNNGSIRTGGNFAYGILGQSVGGGGGSGGNSTTFQLDAGIMPHLDDFLLIAPDYSFSLSVGGSSSGGGHGGAVNIASTGPITTYGGFAHGILAQSVGGGGGSAGDATTIEVAAGINPSEVLPFTRSMKGDNVMVLGGRGGAGGNGGLVAVQNLGDITTAGGFATGILAQSVGGGGGTSGSSIKDEYSLINPLGSSMILRGGSGASGNGSNVSVTNSARITTNGVFSHGILAQSIGGGGGFGGISEVSGISSLGFGAGARGVFAQNTGFGVGFAGSIGGSGSSGAVNVTHTGSITTFGNQSHGILAQSAAGTGTAGAVTVTVASSVIANGTDSDGIHAQSTGGTGRGNISITNGGVVQGGSGAGVGVNIDGGANNTLTNMGSGTISALSGKAIAGGIGNDTIVNYGSVVGSVQLGAGANAFQNKAGARFDAGQFVDLGVGNALINDGIFSPGGAGTILGTTVFGDFVQSDIGILEIDIGGFSAGLFDSIDITGALIGGTAGDGSSSPGGTIRFSFLSGYDIFAGLDPGERMVFEFLDVEGSPGFLSASLFSYEFLGNTSGFQFDVFLSAGGLYLEALYAVPAPDTLFLALLGLICVGWHVRRRDASSLRLIRAREK